MKVPPTFFVPGDLRDGALVALPEEERRHIRARRLSSGSPVRLIDGRGGVADGKIEALDATGVRVRVERCRAPSGAGIPRIVLAPVVRAPRLAWMVEKATELGADRILLVKSSRAQGERASEAERDGARLSRLAREAAKQSARASVPSVEGPMSFEEAVGVAAEARFLLDPDGALFPASLSVRSVALWIGPEGGFTPGERAAAEASGWTKIRLPGGTLRAETAVVAAVALAGRAIDSAAGRADNNATP